jgi:CheY-like chemotaxis protein
MNNQTNTPEKADILIVDDTPANLRLLFQLLSAHNYRVRAAISGKQALEAAHATTPDLILLDIMMPEMSGYEVCQHLKADEQTQNVPVIFLSALSDTRNKISAFAAGGVDYITKPFQAEEVLARARAHLTIYHLQKMLQTRNEELQAKNHELAVALAQVKRLSGLLPICASCKKIRNDEGYWQQVEVYIHQHSEADFTHGICPDCMQKLYPEQYQRLETRRQDILTVLSGLGRASLEDIALAVSMPASNTLNRLQILIEERQVEHLEIEGKIIYKLL